MGLIKCRFPTTVNSTNTNSASARLYLYIWEYTHTHTYMHSYTHMRTHTYTHQQLKTEVIKRKGECMERTGKRKRKGKGNCILT